MINRQTEIDLINCFREGNVEGFKALYPAGFLKDELVTILSMMGNAEKYDEQKAMMEIVNDPKQ